MKKLLFLSLTLLSIKCWSAPQVWQLIGFENGDSGELFAGSGTWSIGTSIVRTGTYSARTNPTLTGTGYVECKANYDQSGVVNLEGLPTLSFAASKLYTTAYFRVATMPVLGSEVLAEYRNTNGAMMTRVRINAITNTVSIYDSSDNLLANGATAITTNAWHRLDYETHSDNISPSLGGYQVWIDSVVQFGSVSGDDFDTFPVGSVRFGKTLDSSSQSVDFYFDDISFSSMGYIGGSAIKLMHVDGDGTFTAWPIDTGCAARWQCVDEVPADSATSQLDGFGTGGNVDTVNLESSATAGLGSNILAVKPMIVAARDGTNSAYLTRVRASGSNFDSQSRRAGPTYEARAWMQPFNPNTGVAWTTAILDGLEIGANENGSGTFMTTVLTSVLYEVSDTPASTSHNGIETRGVYWGGVGTK